MFDGECLACEMEEDEDEEDEEEYDGWTDRELVSEINTRSR
jgi:hypothetical protein